MGNLCCYIKEQYFIERPELINILDSGNTPKQARRKQLCMQITFDGDTFYIPFRTHLGDDVRRYGRIGHSVPSVSRPEAGLDYRYTLVINNSDYIIAGTDQMLPNSQHKKLQNEILDIEEEFITYYNGFIRAFRKGRLKREPLYRYSSLINFVDELGIAPKEPALT